MSSSAGGGDFACPGSTNPVGLQEGRVDPPGGCDVCGMEQVGMELGALIAEAGTDHHD